MTAKKATKRASAKKTVSKSIKKEELEDDLFPNSESDEKREDEKRGELVNEEPKGEDKPNAEPEKPTVIQKKAEATAKNLILAVPILDKEEPFHSFAIKYLLSKYHGKIGYDMVLQSEITDARNALANRFLNMRTKPSWLLFLDSDIVPPIGSAAVQQQYFKMRFNNEFDNIDVIQRLVKHQKAVVSGLYFQKEPNGLPEFGDAKTNPNLEKEARNAPVDKIIPISSAGAGCLLINRAGLEKMVSSGVVDRASNGDYGFFTPSVPNQGEDTSFFARAKEAGIQPYLDLGCVCGHVGKHIFFG